MSKHSNILSPGDRLGNYQIEESIAQGGMGQVYKVHDLETKNHVALKVLHSQFQSDEDAIRRFQHEAREAAKLDHQRILKTYALRTDPERGHFLTMYLAEGFVLKNQSIRSLNDLVTTRGPLGEAQTLHYLSQALDGLQYAHSKKRIHYDITPPNLLLKDENNLLIADFGLIGALRGNRQEDLPPESTPILGGTAKSTLTRFPGGGTKDYTSPEQDDPALFGLPDHRTDLYLLGLVAHFLLFGHSRISSGSVSRRHDDLRPDWDAWFEKMTESDPSNRFTSAEEAREALPSSPEKTLFPPLRDHYQSAIKSIRAGFDKESKVFVATQNRAQPFDQLPDVAAVLESAIEARIAWKSTLETAKEHPPRFSWNDLSAEERLAAAKSAQTTFAELHQKLELELLEPESQQATFQERLAKLESLTADVRRDATEQLKAFQDWSPDPIKIESPVGDITPSSHDQVFEWINSTALSDARQAERHLSNLVEQIDAFADRKPVPEELDERSELVSQSRDAIRSLRLATEKRNETWDSTKRHADFISSKHQDFVRAEQEHQKLNQSLKTLQERAKTAKDPDPEARANLVEAERLAMEAVDRLDKSKDSIMAFRATEGLRSEEFAQLIQQMLVTQGEADGMIRQFEVAIRNPSAVELVEGFGAVEKPEHPRQTLIRWLITAGSLIVSLAIGGWYFYSNHQRPEEKAMDLRERGRYEEADRVYSDAITRETNPQTKSELLAKRAQMQFEEGRWESALDDCTKALETYEDNAPALALKGYLQREIHCRNIVAPADLLEQCHSFFEAAQKLDSELPEAIGFKSLVQMQVTADPAYVRGIHRALAKAPVDHSRKTAWVYHLADAYGHWRLGRQAQKRAAAKECLIRFDEYASRRGTPDSIEVFRAYVHYFLGTPEDFQKAVELCKDAILSMQKSSRRDTQHDYCLAFAYKVLGDSYTQLGEYENARDALRQAIETDPNFLLATINYCNSSLWPNLEERKREVDAAWKKWKGSDFLLKAKASTMLPEPRVEWLRTRRAENSRWRTHPQFHRLLAEAHYLAAQEEFTGKVEENLKVALTHPEAYQARIEYANYLAKHHPDGFDRALELFKEAMRIDPLLPTAHLEAIKRAREANRPDAATQLYEFGVQTGGINQDEPWIQTEIGITYANSPNSTSEEHHLSTSFGWFERAAIGGNAAAMTWIAAYYNPDYHATSNPRYDYGAAGFTPDAAKAIQWYEQAAEIGSSFALRKIGESFQHGWHPELEEGGSDYRKAYDYFLKAALKGDDVAMYEVGHYFRDDRDTQWERGYDGIHQPNPAMAANWYEQSALEGSAVGMYFLALAYESGWVQSTSAEVSKVKAYEWLERAADEGLAEAMYRLGEAFRVGDHPASTNNIPDHENAFKWHQKAADSGHSSSMRQIGNYYRSQWPDSWMLAYKGVVEPDNSKAIAWFERAAASGSGLAYQYLGYAFLRGWHPKSGVKTEIERKHAAVEQFNEGAKHKDANSMRKIGDAYRHGWHPGGVDLLQAFQWLTKAANLGSDSAYTNLRELYCDLHGVDGTDLSEVLEWLEAEDAKGNIKATTELGYVFREGGETFSNDPQRAFDQFTKGHEAGDARATGQLANFYYPWDSDSWAVGPKLNEFVGGAKPERARELLEQAAKGGYSYAWYRLGFLYRDGHLQSGVDFEKAFQRFKNAAESGYGDAYEEIRKLYSDHHDINGNNLSFVFAWLNTQAANNKRRAKRELGFMYRDGGNSPSVSQDMKEALGWFREGAESGDSESMNQYAHFYRDQRQSDWEQKYISVEPVDARKAISWYQNAGDLGNRRGYKWIAYAYKDGWHPESPGEKDFELAIKWFHRAAKLGESEALYEIGEAFAEGWHPSLEENRRDLKAAFRFFKDAAKKGHRTAMEYLGHYYAKWEDDWAKPYKGVERESAETAIFWYSQASEKGDASCARRIAWAFVEGWHPDSSGEDDYRGAFEWFELAANRGDTNAMVQYGHYFRDQRQSDWEQVYKGIQEIDAEKAITWYRKAGDAGRGAGYYWIAYAFKDGWHPDSPGKRDVDSALNWLHKAAKLGYTDAMWAIGDSYREDWHPDGEDYAKALDWFRDAANAGDKDGMAAVADFYRPRSDSDSRKAKYRAVIPIANKVTAINSYIEAAEKGDLYAMRMIGEGYANGWFDNYEIAKNWVKKAISLGNTKAEDTLRDIEQKRTEFAPIFRRQR